MMPEYSFAPGTMTTPANKQAFFLILTYESNHTQYSQKAEENHLPGKSGRRTGDVW